MKVVVCILAVSLVVSLCVTVVNAQQDLALYYSFDNVSGDEVRDDSGNQNHGTMVGGAAIVDGQVGKALLLDGVNSAVEVAHSDSLDIGEDSISFHCWLDTQTTLAFVRIVSKGNFGWTSGYIFQLGPGTRVAVSMANGTSAGLYVVANRVINDGQWHHLTGIADRDMNEVRIFIDGELAENELPPFETKWGPQVNPKEVGAVNNDNPLTIGKWEANLEYLDATVDELYFWRRALTDAEVQQAMAGTITAVDPREKLPVTWGKLKFR